MEYKKDDIVAYLFNPDVLKYGVMVEDEVDTRAKLYTLMKGADDFWQFKPGFPTIEVDSATIVANLNDRVTVFGREFMVELSLRIEKEQAC